MDKTIDHFDPRSEVAKKLNEYPYYTARPIKVNKAPGTWETCEVGVFEKRADGSEAQIGSYQRNYRFLETFWWFRRDSRHFALFSAEYTATRIMEILPGEGLRDIGGEEPASGGFCPVEFYVPDCRKEVFQEESGKGDHIADWNSPLASLPAGCEFTKNAGTHRGRAKLRGADGNYLEWEQKIGWRFGEWQQYESGWVKFPPNHGFVSGCVWGDDSSWKTQYLDLSRVEDGFVRREERFGYIELPRSIPLRNAIHIYGLLDTPQVHIAVSTAWDLQSGKMKPLGVPPWDEE